MAGVEGTPIGVANAGDNPENAVARAIAIIDNFFTFFSFK